MWKEKILKDIEKIKFNSNKLFTNPTTNDFITRDEYINIALNDFLLGQKNKIESLGGLKKLETLESNLGSIMHIILNKRNHLECNEELAKSILTYIYWKYKNPKNKIRSVNINHVKKAIGLKTTISTEELISPLEFNTKCYMCNSHAKAYIPLYGKNKVQFKCQCCEHFYQTAPTNDDYIEMPYVECNCTYCNNIKNRIFEKCINWFNTLKTACDDLVKALNSKVTGLPDDKTMKKHFETYISSKKYNAEIDIPILKEFMNYKPTSTDELCDFINNNSDYFDLTYNLKGNHMIYDVKQERFISTEILLIDYILGDPRNSHLYNFEKFLKYITEGEFIYNYIINEEKNAINLRYNNRKLGFIYCENFNIIHNIDINEISKYLYEDVSIINPYFDEYYSNHFQKQNIINELSDTINDFSESDLELILGIAKTIKNTHK